MKNILVTGGTLFVSKYLAEYFKNQGHNVYVYNRNTHPQLFGVKLIQGDKTKLSDRLKEYSFDLVVAVNIYNATEMQNLVQSLGEFKDFVFISSSAVYPETTTLPFCESASTGFNSIWQGYGVGKFEAEKYLLDNIPSAYIIRPPYLIGKYQNLYREGFVFDCAMNNRQFCIPKGGDMLLHFFDVHDLGVFIENLVAQKPADRIFNVGSYELLSINEFVKLCYDVVGAKLKVINIDPTYSQRDYFPFYDYEYYLDVTRQRAILPQTTAITDTLKASFDWYISHQDEVNKKDYFKYIDEHLIK